MKLVMEELMTVSEPGKNEDASQVVVVDDDGDSARGYAGDDNAYHDEHYFHMETKNNNAGVVQDLKADYDNQKNDFENSFHDLKAYYMVNVAVDGVGSGVDTIRGSRGMEVGHHPMSSVNLEENVYAVMEVVLVNEEMADIRYNSTMGS